VLLQGNHYTPAANATAIMSQIATLMAAQRTHLAWVRTSLALVGITIVFNKLILNKEALRPSLARLLTVLGKALCIVYCVSMVCASEICGCCGYTGYGGAVFSGMYGLYDYLNQLDHIEKYNYAPGNISRVRLIPVVLWAWECQSLCQSIHCINRSRQTHACLIWTYALHTHTHTHTQQTCLAT
jgi:uncharacterized membrane protein YidH (DUF202 family)